MNPYLKMHPAYAAAKAQGMTDDEFAALYRKSRLKESNYALDQMKTQAGVEREALSFKSPPQKP